MGRLKIEAKMQLLGYTVTLMAIFVLMASAMIIPGNFSFIAARLIAILPVSLQGQTVSGVLDIALPVGGIILTILVLPPVKLGIERWFILRAEGECPGADDVFFYFYPSEFLYTQRVFWYAVAVKGGVFLFFQFPAICLSGVTFYAIKSGEVSDKVVSCLMAATAAICLTAIIFYFIYSTQWHLYYRIIVSDDTIKPGTARKISAEHMSDFRWKLCVFRLSFIPWWLLCVFLLPLFYVWGYYKQSMSLLAVRKEGLI